MNAVASCARCQVDIHRGEPCWLAHLPSVREPNGAYHRAQTETICNACHEMRD